MKRARAVCGQPSFSRDTLSMRDPWLGLGTWSCALRPRPSGNKASEEHELRSDETNKTARTTETACTAQSKESETHCVISQERDRSNPNRLLCHLTRKGPLFKRTNCCVISQERDCSLKQTKTPIKFVATDHKMRVDHGNLVTTCGMALRLVILIAGGSVSP